MNTTFLTFRDHAMASGIMDNKPQLVQELTRTTERLLSLAQMAVAQSDHEDNQTSEIQSQKEKSPKSDTTKSRKRTKRDWSSQNSSSGTSSLLVEVTLPQNNRDEIGHGVESTPLQANDDVQRYMGSDCSTEEHTQSSDVNWDAVMQQSRLESHGGTNQMRSPSPTRDSSLHTPFTYSFQESSFARRLQRASIERAYYILNNPNLAPEDLSRIFKFTFFYTNANAITGRLRQLLTRSSSESLDNWTAPLKHLGGAGTHYPRLEANGSKALSPNMRAVGPQLLMPQTPRPENATTEQLLRLTGWDGEWFDSNDVEQYLRTEKGLRLDGHSTFAEVEMPISSLSPAASSNQRSLTNSSSDNGKERKAFNESLSSSRLVSQSHNYFSTSSDAFNQLNETGVGTDMNAGLPDSENDGTDPMGYPFGYNSPAWQDLRPRNPRPTLTIDVSKLLGSKHHLFSWSLIWVAPQG